MGDEWRMANGEWRMANGECLLGLYVERCVFADLSPLAPDLSPLLRFCDRATFR
ncbi:hypothetical protein AB3R30_23995 [Leptolyngbyaceae cyanobacterium UHCC 1019]